MNDTITLLKGAQTGKPDTDAELGVTDTFGTDPTDVIDLAAAAAETGITLSPHALIVATNTAEDLTDEHVPPIADAFMEALRVGAAPADFIRIFDLTNTLDIAFPQLAALRDVPAGPQEHHREGDALTHTLLVMDAYHNNMPNDQIGLLGALAHDLGKACTDPDDYPHHYGHAKNGVEPAKELAAHLGAEQHATAMAQAAEQHMRFRDLPKMNHSKIIRLVDTVSSDDGFQPFRCIELLVADSLGRIPPTTVDTEVYEHLIDVAERVMHEHTEADARREHPDTDDENIPDIVLSNRTHAFDHHRDNSL